ncbi:hypothetical protein HK097_004647, partial [Rhizophlyctis rosea]
MTMSWKNGDPLTIHQPRPVSKRMHPPVSDESDNPISPSSIVLLSDDTSAIQTPPLSTSTAPSPNELASRLLDAQNALTSDADDSSSEVDGTRNDKLIERTAPTRRSIVSIMPQIIITNPSIPSSREASPNSFIHHHHHTTKKRPTQPPKSSTPSSLLAMSRSPSPLLFLSPPSNHQHRPTTKPSRSRPPQPAIETPSRPRHGRKAPPIRSPSAASPDLSPDEKQKLGFVTLDVFTVFRDDPGVLLYDAGGGD